MAASIKGKPTADHVPTPQDLERLFALSHPDPHSILGAHSAPLGTIVRAYRPDAQRIDLVVSDGAPQPMTRREGTDLFEALVRGVEPGFTYRFEIVQRNGARLSERDPYSFLPTLGELDLYLLREQTLERPWDKLGANVREIEGVAGVGFAVWAPNAIGISVVGDFNHWDGRPHMMRMLGSSGVWELFIPGLGAGERYKYEIRHAGGGFSLKADPYAKATERPPATASLIYRPEFSFGDDQWMRARPSRDALRSPMSIYELHLGSWRRRPEERNRPLTYRELAHELADYLSDLGFTHVELLPVMEHPFTGSWGYQVTSYFAPTSRYGAPDDFRYMVDYLHQRGIGVILDWVPAHFPKDEFSLGRFDGTALYEHLDPRQGESDWGTYVFNYGRDEVREFIVSNALFWLSDYHADGLRVDAVASMLYLDYAKKPGQWVPNVHGGRENLAAINLLRTLNERAYGHDPGVITIAEESTDWPAVSRPTYLGGLGFGLKWDMGWMHDTLEYFSKEPIHRRFHHRDLTFGLLYAYSENFILPLSHDEVVYGKRSMYDKMPGDRWQKFANLRSLYAYMWARPGKKLLFMGGEFAQVREWNHDQSLDWHLLQYPEHRAMQTLLRDLNRIYRAEPALWMADIDPAGFRWIDADDADDNVIAFIRSAPTGRKIICICNFSPVVRRGHRFGLPGPGYYSEILNTDSFIYTGSNVGNNGGVNAEPIPSHGLDHSAVFTLPPLGVVWLASPG
jgi:1,4-alpha-glucan branching enzyme